jgi:hypothetical protein
MAITRKSFAALAAVAALGAAVSVAAPGAASATTSPDSVGLTITPTTTVVGDQVTVVATLTNNTSTTVSGALGIENPQYASEKITGVTGHACATRNLEKLIYCGPSLSPGATASIVVTLVPTTTGTDNFTAYGRITNTNDTLAHGTLTVS